MCFAQGDGQLLDSTMKTYVINARYVVRYFAATNKRHINTIPMATYLSRRYQHYQRNATKTRSEQSWQVLDSKNQWIHW